MNPLKRVVGLLLNNEAWMLHFSHQPYPTRHTQTSSDMRGYGMWRIFFLFYPYIQLFSLKKLGTDTLKDNLLNNHMFPVSMNKFQTEFAVVCCVYVTYIKTSIVNSAFIQFGIYFTFSRPPKMVSSLMNCWELLPFHIQLH